MSFRIALLAAVTVLAVGCGGPGSFNGKVDGKELAVEDAIFAPVKGSDGKVTGVAVILSDVPDLCAAVKANRDPKGATIAQFAMMRIASDGSAVLAPDVGDYGITDNPFSAKGGNIAFGGFIKSDLNCANEVASDRALARERTVKIETIELQGGWHR